MPITMRTTGSSKNESTHPYPLQNDDICISGISGRYPKSWHIGEFEYNLYNKIDMVDDKETRWKQVDADIPKRMGKIDDLEKFDSTFFGIHRKQSKTMDPQSRIVIEKAYEAIVDAGINPTIMKGSKTGVFIGACFSESEKEIMYEKSSEDGMGITGGSRAMFANRISYCLGLQGPSFLIDTACSSSMYAFDCAFRSIRNGQCDAALVGGCNILLHPNISREFSKLGVLSADGYCRPFSCDASGYTRSEAISVVFLQKVKDAKRIYASVISTKTNCDGYKPEGITFPSRFVQEKLMREFYQEINIHPNSIAYIEAHSTGTLVGDPEECYAIDEVLCKGRQTPLLIGSVKSNMGHSESSSGVCSISKVILALERGIVAPNINFKSVRNVPSLVEGRLKVCTEPTKLDGSLVCINSFGFGGANAHALLCGNPKEKKNHGLPMDSLPRLVLWSGRTEDCIETLAKDIQSKPLDAEFIGLLHNIQSVPTPGHNYRGFGLFENRGKENAICTAKNFQYFDGIQRPVVWVFSGMGSQWTRMGLDMMQIPLFRESIESSHEILVPFGLDLKNIITSNDPKVLQNILNIFVGIAAIQVALVILLKKLKIEPDFIVGHSVGELGCAYADGCFTAKQMILSAYARGLVSLQSKTIKGSMAAVGLGYKDLKDKLMPGIEIACHNGPHSSTISGPEELIHEYVTDLQKKGIFAKAVPSSNIAYHSKFISQMGPKLLEELKKIIPNPQKRTSKWLSSSVPMSDWADSKNQLSSAEYHTNNLLSPVLFEEVTALLPQNALLIEIAPHGLLQAIFKKSMSQAMYIPLTHRSSPNNLSFFLNGIGKIYLHGLHIPVSCLYPPIDFPVSRGTAMISPLIKWNHSEDHFVAKYGLKRDIGSGGEKTIVIDLKDSEYKYIEGHRIDGRCILPATGYLSLVWKALSAFMEISINAMNIEFEDVRFIRATALNQNQNVELLVNIQCGTGRFEITERGSLVVSGIVRHVEHPESVTTLPSLPETKYPILNGKDFYKELRLRGYHYDGEFRNVLEARGDGLFGKVKWENKWVSFLDCLLQINIIGHDTRNIILPTRIHKMRINIMDHIKMAANLDPENPAFDVQVCPELGVLVAGGVEITMMQTNTVSRRKPPGIPILESYQFIPLLPAPILDQTNAIRVCCQLAAENNLSTNIRIVEVQNPADKNTILIDDFQNAFNDIPLIVPELVLLADQEYTLEHVKVENNTLSSYHETSIVIGSKVLYDNSFIENARKCLIPNGLLICQENIHQNISNVKIPPGFNLLAAIPLKDKTIFVFICLKDEKISHTAIVNVSSNDQEYTWLKKLKEYLKTKDSVLIVAQNDRISGILGLVNCIRREPKGDKVKCIFIDDESAPPFDPNVPFYSDHLKQMSAFNVYRNGKWGTYRHLILNQETPVKPRTDHCYSTVLHKGDLSTFRWFEGPIDARKSDNVVNVHYNALNFRDVMLATGRISMETFSSDRLGQDLTLGFEFSGMNKRGQRVMGTAISGCMGTQVIPDHLTWMVPENWSLRDAATVPVVYVTVYLAFFMKNPISKGKTILIHAGSGGIGLAAIRVALAYGLSVYTTVSTPQKKKYIMSLYPQLKESNIGNSRDCSFEKMIKMQTKGRGVDYVLNSLSDDKLQASIRCLGNGGTFLEIGKFDLVNDSQIGLGHFMKDLTFCSVLADRMFGAKQEDIYELYELIDRDIKSGIIQPLDATVFEVDEVEKAYRYLSTGKHVGKVLIKMRETPQSVESVPIKALPRVQCDKDMVYIIPGGLGGFGLELADWLILRGARKIVLSSSRGITSTYQQFRIKVWESYGCQILVSTDDITTWNGCKQLLTDSLVLGPIGGIFNLAVVLRDSILENQTTKSIAECMAPKYLATKYFDELSRKLCPHLKYFVVFSSVSCGRGNAGQTNYGMANSLMERIVEQRVAAGLPGKAIQWGAIGEVGLVAQMVENKLDLEIGGTIQQRISSCLTELDPLITTTDPVVSCMVVAEKHFGSSAKTSAMEMILKIFGIKDNKSISMTTSLSEMGMDSLMMVEIKQTLEREYETFLSTEDLRFLTFSKLTQMTTPQNRETGSTGTERNSVSKLNLLYDSMASQAERELPFIRLQTLNNSSECKDCMLIVPGIEGIAHDIWRKMATDIQMPAYFLQFISSYTKTSLMDITNSYFKHIVNDILKDAKKFYIVGYSYGSVIAIELARLLERHGKTGQIVIIDGGPALIKSWASKYIGDFGICNEVLLHLAMFILPPERVKDDIKKRISECNTNEQKINKFFELIKHLLPVSESFFRKMIIGIVNRIASLENMDYLNVLPKIESPILLIRSLTASIQDVPDDYSLSRCTAKPVHVSYIEGDHNTMLNNPDLVVLINKYCS